MGICHLFIIIKCIIKADIKMTIIISNVYLDRNVSNMNIANKIILKNK